MDRVDGAAWRKSSYSGANGGNCVEVAATDAVLVRDTQDRHGPTLRFAPEAWRKFADRVKPLLASEPNRACRRLWGNLGHQSAPDRAGEETVSGARECPG